MITDLSEIFAFASTQTYCIQTISGMSQTCFEKILTANIRWTLIDIVIAYIIISAFTSYFLSYAYKSFLEMTNDTKVSIIWDFRMQLWTPYERMKLKLWIQDRLAMLLIGGLLLCIIFL